MIAQWNDVREHSQFLLLDLGATTEHLLMFSFHLVPETEYVLALAGIGGSSAFAWDECRLPERLCVCVRGSCLVEVTGRWVELYLLSKVDGLRHFGKDPLCDKFFYLVTLH
jgi:hypothetical protein